MPYLGFHKGRRYERGGEGVGMDQGDGKRWGRRGEDRGWVRIKERVERGRYARDKGKIEREGKCKRTKERKEGKGGEEKA